MEMEFNHRNLTFMTPSGHLVTIREQNGEDDDILSNPVEAQSMTNLSRFISSIVVECDYNPSKRLSVQQAHELPALDRYCILLNSRRFSLGDEVEFTYDWGKDNGGSIHYTQSISEFLFDYSEMPSPEEVEAKPNAIPFYPLGKQFKDIPFETSTGKKLMFDLLNAKAETYLIELPLEQRTKNKELVARNLRLEVNGVYEKVTNFRMFTVKEMSEIRKEVLSVDPLFYGNTDIENPTTGQVTQINIVAIKDFFYPGEM